MKKPSVSNVFNKGTGKDLVAALAERPSLNTDGHTISGYARVGSADSLLFSTSDSDEDSIEIPLNIIESAIWGKPKDGLTPVTIQIKKASTTEGQLAFSLLNQIVAAVTRRVLSRSNASEPSSRVPCHMCGCTNWYDPNGNGLCNGTDFDHPGDYCGHPVVSHY